MYERSSGLMRKSQGLISIVVPDVPKVHPYRYKMETGWQQGSSNPAAHHSYHSSPVWTGNLEAKRQLFWICTKQHHFETFFPLQTSNNTGHQMERLDRKCLESGAKTCKVIGRTFRLSHSKGPISLLLPTAAQGFLLVQGLTLAAHHRPVASRDVSQGLTKLLPKRVGCKA